ncbi:hypothetical protein BH23CHL1_BH23CHL1_15010 [soil metagenome]
MGDCAPRSGEGYPIHILVGSQEYADIEFVVGFLGGFIPWGLGEALTNQQVRQVAIEVAKNLGTQRADFERQVRKTYGAEDPAGMLTGIVELLLIPSFQRAVFDAVITVGSEDDGVGAIRLGFSLFAVIVVEVVTHAVAYLVKAIVNSLVHGVGMLHMLGANMVLLATGAPPQIIISGPAPTPTPIPIPIPAPSAPQNVQATLTGNNELTITWEPGSGNEDAFEIRVRETEGYGDPLATLPGDTSMFVWAPKHQGVFDSGTGHVLDIACFALNAVNAGGSSEQVEVCVDKPQEPPVQPTNAQLRYVSDRLELTWEAATNNVTALDVAWLDYTQSIRIITRLEPGLSSFAWDGYIASESYQHLLFQDLIEECLLVRSVNEAGASDWAQACTDRPQPPIEDTVGACSSLAAEQELPEVLLNDGTLCIFRYKALGRGSYMNVIVMKADNIEQANAIVAVGADWLRERQIDTCYHVMYEVSPTLEERFGIEHERLRYPPGAC